MKFDFLRALFICGSFAAMLYGMIDNDVTLAGFMGASFGFQLALWLIDSDSKKRLDARRKEVRAKNGIITDGHSSG